jgi:DNA-binding transcriptional regulator LsrR (DeoR family)
LNAGMTVSAVARSMGVSRAAVHRAMERIARAAE